MAEQSERVTVRDMLVSAGFDPEHVDQFAEDVERVAREGFHRTPAPLTVTSVEELEALVGRTDIWLLIHGHEVPLSPSAAWITAGTLRRVGDVERMFPATVLSPAPALAAGPGQIVMDIPEPGCVTHACPPEGKGVMPCCGRTPFEVPRTDRITIHRGFVTCQPAPSNVHVTDEQVEGDRG